MSKKIQKIIAAVSAAVCIAACAPVFSGCGAPASYSAIFDKLAEIMPQYNIFDEIFGGFGTNAKNDDMTESPAADGKNYSDTNIQVAGVQEADSVKTDGEYVYVLGSNVISVLRADGADTEKVSEIDINADANSADSANSTKSAKYAFGLYLYNKKLVVLSGYHYYDGSSYYYDYYYYGSDVEAEVYDVSDASAPKKQHSFKQSGSSVGSRMIGEKLYFLSNKYVYRKEVNASDPKTYVPTYTDDGNTYAANAKDVVIPDDVKSPNFLSVSEIDVVKGERVSSLSIMGYAGIVYCSENNLYYTKDASVIDNSANNYKYKAVTQITKIALGGELKITATGVVDGYVSDQFFMDEYKGYLRVVSDCIYNSTIITESGNQYVSERSARLTVLDENLKQTGVITKIAKNETLKSARFYGDTAYFVTFLQKDPLFEADLSDPAAPVIVGELKIPGFSEYMQRYGENLFGFGCSATDEGRVTGLKLSMFAKKDGLLSEVSNVTIENEWSEANYNHHAILVNYNKNLICFPTYSTYFVYGYGESGFYKKAELSLDFDSGWYNQLRGNYIGEYFYVTSWESVAVYSLDDFTLAASINIGSLSNGGAVAEN